MKMLDSEEEMIAADYRIPMSIGETPHAEVLNPLLIFNENNNQFAMCST